MAVILGTEGPDSRDGTPGNDTFVLLGGSDIAIGGAGFDLMNGGPGNDSLFAGDDPDTLIGGTGRDHLFGGSGADTFRYFSVEESPVGAGNRDSVEDFQRGQDIIDLSRVDADANAFGDQAFILIGSQFFHGVAGELRVNIDSSGILVARMDVNGDSAADMQIEVHGTNSLFATDFIL